MKNMRRTTIALLVLLLCFPSAHGQNHKLYKEGYCGNISAISGIVMAKGISDREFSIETCHGHSFGNGAFFGGGIGAKNLSGGVIVIPIFVDFKYAFLDDKLSPFLDLKGGLLAGSTYGSSFIRLGGGVDCGILSMGLNYQLEGGSAYRLHSVNIAFGVNF